MIPKNLLATKGKKQLSGKEARELTTINLADALLDILTEHIGVNNAVTKEELFMLLFNKKFNDDDLRDYVRWDFVKKAMHKLRQKTKCFVVSTFDKVEQTWLFFVIKNKSDAQIYVDRLDNCIKRMRAMQKRAKKAAKEEWYKEDWLLTNNKQERLQ